MCLYIVLFHQGLFYAVLLPRVTFPFRQEAVRHLHVCDVGKNSQNIRRHAYVNVDACSAPEGGGRMPSCGCQGPALPGRTSPAVATGCACRIPAGRRVKGGGDAPSWLCHPRAAGRGQLEWLGCDFSFGWVLEIPSCARLGSVPLGGLSLLSQTGSRDASESYVRRA